MKTLIVYPIDEKQDKALRSVFDALQVQYDEEPMMDETERILSNPKSADKLNKSLAEVKEGKITKISVEDLWR